MEISINRNEFKMLVKEAIKEVIEEERIGSFLKSISPVSKEEMEDINELYGKPSMEKLVSFSEEMEV